MRSICKTISIGLVALSAVIVPAYPATTEEEPGNTTHIGAAAAQPATSPKAPTEAAESKVILVKAAHIRLTGPVAERRPDFSLFGDLSRHATLSEWLQRLAKARKDPDIRAVALQIESPSMGWAQAQELADSIRRLAAVKPVYTHLTSGGIAKYLVASAATEVTMEPAGVLGIVGLAAEVMFFRGTLDKLGIQPQMIQIGQFKGAAEPLSRTGPSRELELEYNKILDGLYDELCSRIATHRNVTAGHIRATIDKGPFTAAKAQNYGLVDNLGAQSRWLEDIASRIAPGKAKAVAWQRDYGKGISPRLDLSNPFALMSALFKGRAAPKIRKPTVAIVYAEGMIVQGQGEQGLFGQQLAGAKTLVKTFDRLADDDRVKAVILRVNSPGGSALACELIYQSIRRCAAKKPVIVSVADLAASGGYYIAVAGTKIIADPAAIVGSIGVVSGKLALRDFLANKLGITTYAITRGRNAGLYLLRPWTAREKEIIRKQAQRVYDRFVARVKQGRGNKIANISAVAQGRVFTARQALENKMIDQIGGLNEALAAARAAAGIKKYHLISLPRPRTLMDLLTSDEDVHWAPPQSLELVMLRRLVGQQQRLAGIGAGAVYLLNLADQMDQERVLAAVPWHLSVRR